MKPSRLGLLLLIATLAGCQAPSGYREGQRLLGEGRVEESLTRFQDAIRAEPTNAAYRSAYLAARERTTYAWLEQADRLRAAGNTVEAIQLYQRVLAIDPGNARAKTGNDELTRFRRHGELFKQAQAAWQKNDRSTALDRLRTILLENPRHAEATELRRAIDESAAQTPGGAPLAEALKKPITIEFRDAPVKQVFEVFARTSGLNFVFDRDVRPDLRTTVFLRNTTVADAMALVLLTSQLEQRVLDAHSVLIYPNTPAKAREYQQLTVRTFFLNNADVKTAANTLATIVRTRDLIVDEKQNMIIMRDTPEAVRLAERLLAFHDLPEPEVMLEVEILEVTRNRLVELGVQWPAQLSLSPLSTTGGAVLTLADLRNISAGSLEATVGPVIGNARKEDADANLLANPRIRSRNREKARIVVGDRVPTFTTTATSTGFITESVTYIDVGLKLEVEPTIFMDDEVAIKVALEVSNIVGQIQTRAGSLAFQIGTRNATSVLRLKDGENQVLAGLINDNDRASANKVPGLGDLPIIGRLFGSRRDDRQKTEVVLSITPRILRNPQRPASRDAEFNAGTEASLKNRGQESARVAQAVPASATADVAGGGGILPPSQPLQPSATEPAASPSPPPPPPVRDDRLVLPAPDSAPPVAAAGVGLGPTASAGAGRPGAGGPSGAPAASPPIPTTRPAVSTTLPAGKPAAARSGENATFSLNGPASVAVGDTFAITLGVQSSQPLVSIPFSIGFNPKVLEVVSVTEGDFAQQGGAKSTFTTRLESGRVIGTAARAGTDAKAGTGTVATITMRALTPAPNAPIQFVIATPMGAAGTSVAAQLPKPHALTVRP